MTDALNTAKALLISEYFTEDQKIIETKYKPGSSPVHKLNKRRFKNKQAIKWAFSQGFLSNNPNERQWSMDWEKDIYANRWLAPDAEMLDDDILWEILKNAVRSHAGRSIISNPVWHKLGINPYGDPYHTEADLTKQWRIMAKLGRSYIWFQSCGDLWNIEVRN